MALNVKIERINEAEGQIQTMSDEEVRMRQIYMQSDGIDATEQEALDRINAKIERLRTAVATLRAEIEENKRIFESRSGEWTEAQNRWSALREFRHPDFADINTSVKAVEQSVVDQRWADATTALDQIAYNIDPIWQDYELQIAAQAEYDPLRADLVRRLGPAQAAQPQTETIVGLLGQVNTQQGAIDASVTARDYVTALETLKVVMTELEAAEAEIIRVQQAKTDFDTAMDALRPRLIDASVSEYTALAEQQVTIVALQDQLDSAVEIPDYDSAISVLTELTPAVDAFLLARDELDAERFAYETKLTNLTPRLNAASVSEMPTTIALQEAIFTARDTMTAAADAQNYSEALELAGPVEIALAAYEAVIEDRDLYEVRRAAMNDELIAASVSTPKWTYLQPLQSEMATIQTDMETAATANDFATALLKIAALEAKLAEFYTIIAAKRAEYETARVDIDQRNSHIETCQYPLTSEKTAVRTAVSQTDAAVVDEDWVAALNGVASITAAMDAFDTAHSAHDATLRAQIRAELPALRTAADDDDNGDLSSAGVLRGDIAELDAALAGTDDLTTAMETLARAKTISGDLEQVRSIRDRLDVMWGDDEVAVDIVAELKRDSDLQSLPLEARNMLVESLLTENLFNDVNAAERTAVQDIWKSTAALDPTFQAYDRETTNEIVSNLKTDPEMQQYATNWTTMTPAEQVTAMEHIGEIVGGDDGWAIEGSEDINFTVDQGSCPTNPRLMGSHTEPFGDTPEEITVCMSNTNGTWNPSADFADVVLNLVHEVGHGYQEELMDLYDRDELEPDDPRYEQARSLALDRRYFEEFPADYKDFGIYVHSPMEQQSRQTSNQVRQDLGGQFGSGHHQSLMPNDPNRGS